MYGRIGALALASLVLSAASVFAQYGKVTAKIVDEKTGEPMIHAVCVISQNHLGALSGDNGVATIVNVPPSDDYTVIAKYAGYIPDTAFHVHVSSDITTSLTFKLGTTQHVITVIAQAPLVEKTKTDISTKFNNQEFASIPGRQRIDEVIQLTPGVVQDPSNGGLSFHGSRGTSNSVRLNGVEITDPLTGLAGSLQNGVSRLAISEVDVVTGNADASKGGFTGGEVNSQTRSGGNDLSFQAHYRTEVPSLFGYNSNGFQQMPAGDNTYEFALGGPLVTEDLKFYLTGKLNSFDHYNITTEPQGTFPNISANQGLGVTDPLGNNLGEIPLTNRWRRTATGQLAFDLLGFSLTANAALGAESDLDNSWGTLYEDPYYVPATEYTNNVYSLTARGQVGGGVLEATGAYTLYDIQSGKYDHSLPVDATHLPQFLSVADNYTYNSSDGSISPGADGIIDIYTPVTRQIPDPSDPSKVFSSQVEGLNPFTGHIEGPANSQSSANAYGLVGLFPIAGNTGGFLQENTGQSQFSGNYTVQLGSHLLTAGIDGNIMSIYKYEDDLPWDANPFKDSFLVHPYTGDAYVEDKMEFSDITFHPGLRFDIYQPDSKSIPNLFNPINGGALVPTSVQTQLSPRLAITYAVTDQTTFNFGYNWYFKEPTLDNVLLSTGGGSLTQLALNLARGNQIIGDAGLQAERTKEVDVGFNTQLSDVFAFSVTGIYKDLRNEVGLENISSSLLANSYQIFTDDEYGSDRAVEVVMEKSMADNWSLKLNYTYQSAIGTSSSATDNYSALINQDPSSPQAVLPLTPFPLSFDRTHVANLLFSINYNQGEGPTIFGKKLLEWFSLQTTTDFESGVPYTASDPIRGTQIGSFNGEREPDYFETDAMLSRTIPLEDIFGKSVSTLFLDLSLEVTNVFDRTAPLYVYPATGQGSNDGTNGLYPATTEYYNDPTNIRTGQIDAFGNLYYNPRIDLNHDGRVSLAEQQTAYNQFRTDNYNRAIGYQIPRRVFMNFTIRF